MRAQLLGSCCAASGQPRDLSNLNSEPQSEPACVLCFPSLALCIEPSSHLLVLGVEASGYCSCQASSYSAAMPYRRVNR